MSKNAVSVEDPKGLEVLIFILCFLTITKNSLTKTCKKYTNNPTNGLSECFYPVINDTHKVSQET